MVSCHMALLFRFSWHLITTYRSICVISSLLHPTFYHLLWDNPTHWDIKLLSATAKHLDSFSIEVFVYINYFFKHTMNNENLYILRPSKLFKVEVKLYLKLYFCCIWSQKHIYRGTSCRRSEFINKNCDRKYFLTEKNNLQVGVLVQSVNLSYFILPVHSKLSMAHCSSHFKCTNATAVQA